MNKNLLRARVFRGSSLKIERAGTTKSYERTRRKSGGRKAESSYDDFFGKFVSSASASNWRWVVVCSVTLKGRAARSSVA